MRITGGKVSRRILKVPKGFDVRPTPDLVKQAVFNSLGDRVVDARVLELFAGTGALSLESLSRGAAHAVCVEKSARHAQMIRRNLEIAALSAGSLEVRVQDVFTALTQLAAGAAGFNLVLADPPYGEKNIGQRSQKTLSSLAILLLLASTALGDGSTDYDATSLAKFKQGDLDGALADFNQAVRLTPGVSAPWFHRALVEDARGNLAGALADYTKAIELKPGSANTHANRGNVKQEMGDLAGAIADYSKAIELKPDNPVAHTSRGLLKKVNGDPNGALADYNQAIQLDPNYARAYLNRACLRYDAQQFTAALADFRKTSELNPSLDFPRSSIWLVRAHLGEKEPATKELQAYLQNRQAGQPDDWPLQVARFLAGQLTEPALFKAAENPDQRTATEQLCSAYFYAGEKHLIGGDKAAATQYFEKCVTTGKKDFYDCQSAAAELKLLKAQK